MVTTRSFSQIYTAELPTYEPWKKLPTDNLNRKIPLKG